MADYISSTSTSSLHSSPSRKRIRESLPARSSSSYLSSCETAATVTSNVEVMESTEQQTPKLTITQPRSSIHSFQNGISTIKSKVNTSNGNADSSNGTPPQSPINVSIWFCLSFCQIYSHTSNKSLIPTD